MAALDSLRRDLIRRSTSFTIAGILLRSDPVLARFELRVADYLNSIDVADHERVVRAYST